MTTTTCVGGSAARLIELRFLRPLNEAERHRLEGHLTTCGACQERYRRLQRAERIAAHGVDGAQELPSPFELERIAADLGLYQPEPPRRRAWAWPLAWVGALAVAAVLLVFLPPPREFLQDRGAEVAPANFAVFTADRAGGVVALETQATLQPGSPLKLRVAAPTPVALPGMAAVFVGEGPPVVITLPGLDHVDAPTTVGGVVVVPELPNGAVWLYLVAASAPLDPALLSRSLADRPEVLVAKERLSALVVERRLLQVERTP
jgi:hypothetical protein